MNKNNKKNIKIEKHGEFFAPNYDDYKAPGILYIYDDNSIELDLWGTPDDKKVLSKSATSYLATIVGHTIPDNDYVILHNCVCRRFSGFTSGGNRPHLDNVAKSKWYIELVLDGISFEDYQNLKFNEFVFRIGNSNSYFYDKRLMGFTQIEKKESQLIIDSPAMTCNDIQVHLTDDIVLDISFEQWRPQYVIDSSEITVGLDPLFKLSSKSQADCSFEFFIGLAQKIQLFLSFSQKRHMNIKDLVFLRDDGHRIINIYYSGIPYTSDLDENDSQPLLIFDPKIFNNLLINWIKLHDKLDFIIHLHNLINIGKISWTEERFLVLSRCLEGLHRIFYDEKPTDKTKFKDSINILLNFMEDRKIDPKIQELIKIKLEHANELTFQERMLSLIDIFSEQMAPNYRSEEEIGEIHKKLTKKIKDSRNYYTHALVDSKKKKKKRIPDIDELANIGKQMLMLMDLHLLKLLANEKLSEESIFDNWGLELTLYRFKETLSYIYKIPE